MSSLFTIRAATEADRDAIELMLGIEGMDIFSSMDGVSVAVNESDEPVGFIRVVIGQNQKAYVNPVVVYPTWRGHGVGRALTDHAQDAHGELRLVSRGASKPFYDSMGFKCCGWDLIEPGVSEDCDGCGWREECGPQPMRRVL